MYSENQLILKNFLRTVIYDICTLNVVIHLSLNIIIVTPEKIKIYKNKHFPRGLKLKKLDTQHIIETKCNNNKRLTKNKA